jgi:signal transduction histidine kinase
MADVDLLALLASGRPSDRLQAAREILRRDDKSFAYAVSQARARETDSWVQTALDRVLDRWRRNELNLETGQGWISIPEDSTLEDIRAEAIQAVSRTLIHELSPLVGDIATAAASDLQTFPGSVTEAKIHRLREFLKTVETLNQASEAPRFVEFDLTRLIESVIDNCGFNEQVQPSRVEPIICVGDPGLLEMAVGIVLRNAVEATENGRPVVVNAANTDRNTWIRVLDEGIGLPKGSDKIFIPGRTTKSKNEHFGWGLSIAQRAVHSFGGMIELTPRQPVGTACEISWSRLEGSLRASPHR